MHARTLEEQPAGIRSKSAYRVNHRVHVPRPAALKCTRTPRSELLIVFHGFSRRAHRWRCDFLRGNSAARIRVNTVGEKTDSHYALLLLLSLS